MKTFFAPVLLAGMACGAAPALEPLSGPMADATRESADPALAVDPADGGVLLAWVGGDSASWGVYFARSEDLGERWSAPIRVASGRTEVKPHGESSPRLVAGPGGRIAVIWANSVPVPGRRWPASDMRMARSADGGRSWSPPRTLNDDPTGPGASHQFHGAAWSGDSTLVVAWLDEREAVSPPSPEHQAHLEHTAGDVSEEPDAAIYLAESPDFGVTWEPNRRVAGAACPCCRISLARSGAGEVIATWRKHFPGNIRDVVIGRLEDSIPDPEVIHADGWVYPGCPHAGPALALSGETLHTVWYTGKPGAAGMFYARRPVGRGSVGKVVPLVTGPAISTAHGAVAAFRNGAALVAWDLAGTGAGITLAAIDSSGREEWRAEPESGRGGHHPQLAALPDGGAVVAWTVVEGGRSRVRLVRVP